MYQNAIGAGAARQFDNGFDKCAEPVRQPSVASELDRLHGVTDTVLQQLHDLQQRLSPVLARQPLSGVAGGKEKQAESCGCELADVINGICGKANAASELISQIYSRIEV